MFLDIMEFTIRKKKWLGIIVLKMWSLRFNKKLAYVSPKLILEKSAKTKKKTKRKAIKTFTIFGKFWGQN